ncbi:hypothetical protein NMY22_g13517 [Coprinellus aureogranulatus]|nr:hypothetical protein NMY22_g13517 [Coprinellus aureogranulatus]
MSYGQPSLLIYNARIEDITPPDGPAHCQLAIHLCRDYEVYDPLQRILEALDATLIPRVSGLKFDDALRKKIRDACEGLTEMVVILRSIQDCEQLAGPKPEALAREQYLNRAFIMVTQKWPEITKWMLFLLSAGVKLDPDEMRPAISCGQALRFLFTRAPKENAYREELLSQDITVNVLFVLLRQKDQTVGRYWDHVPTSSGASMISSLLEQCCLSSAGKRAVGGRLATLSAKARSAVIEAIFGRAHETVLQAKVENFEGATLTLRRIISSVMHLTTNQATYRLLDEQNCLNKLSQDFCHLARKASAAEQALAHPLYRPFPRSVWIELTSAARRLLKIAFQSAPHPSRNVATMIDAGILECSFECLAYARSGPSDESILDVLRALLPYLYSAKAVLTRHSLHHPSAVFHDPAPRAQDAFELWTAWKSILEQSAPAFVGWKDRHTGICCNLMDWRDVHSRECATLATTYLKAKSDDLWCSVTMRQDYLRLIHHFANSSLPPASDDMYQAAPRVATDGPDKTWARRVSAIWSWDVSHRKVLALCGILMPFQYVLDSLPDVWKDRMKQMQRLVQQNPNLILVQAFSSSISLARR